MITFVRFRNSIATAALLVATSAIPATATTMIPFDTTDLAHLADVVVVADVIDVRMQEDAGVNGSRTIRTHNVVKVVETWKGSAAVGATLEIMEVGGYLSGGRGFDLEGTAGYLKSERVVVFLEERKAGGYLTVGMFQGKFTLVPSGTDYRLTRLKVPMEKRGAQFDAAQVPMKVPAGVRAEYSAFKSDVTAVVEADRKAGIRGKDLPKYKGIGR